MKVRLRVGGCRYPLTLRDAGYGGLNETSLREDGWDPSMWLEVEQTNQSDYPYRITLPNGRHRFIKDADIEVRIDD